MNILKPSFIKNWQSPAQTEKHYYLNHLAHSQHCDNDDDNKYYFAFPWASFLDFYHDDDIYDPTKDQFYQIIEALDETNKIVVNPSTQISTVCQHIYWYKLIKIWERLNITHVYCSHLTTNMTTCSNVVRINSWPLYAVNKENLKRNRGLVYIEPNKRKYLMGFMGCINEPHYRSDIRQIIYQTWKDNNDSDIFFFYNDDWFFRQETFGNKLCHTIPENTYKYNYGLSNSIFSLCPEGSGPNTIRLWESMSIGSIPVLFDNDWIKPEIKEYEWSDLCIVINSSDIDNLTNILRSIPYQRICELSINCINAYSIFRNLYTGYYLI
jgi:hypothetical protein